MPAGGSDWAGEGSPGPSPVLFAAYRLPLPITAERSVLGLEVGTSFGAAAALVRVPGRQDEDPELDADDLSVSMAGSSGEPAPSGTGRILADWGECGSPLNVEDGQVEIRRLLICVTGLAGELGPARVGVGDGLVSRLSDEMFRAARSWHHVFRSWIEILTLQDLDHERPRWTAHIEGAGIATFRPTGERLGHGGIVRLDSEWPTPATRALVGHAIEAAGRSEQPPLAHLLLRDARAAWYRDQPRRALIDAATATEVALTAVADRGGIPRGEKPRMLGGLLRALEKSGALSQARADNLRALVVNPRNKAVHEGARPSSWDAAEACKAAQQEVWAAHPLSL